MWFSIGFVCGFGSYYYVSSHYQSWYSAAKVYVSGKF